MSITQPDNIPYILFQHQKKSIFTIEKIESTKTIDITENSYVKTDMAIFCDKTGYGKTVSMVTVIYRDLMPFDVSEVITSDTSITYYGNLTTKYIRHKRINIPKVNITLIIASKTIINQWVKTLQLFNIPLLYISSVSDFKTMSEIVGQYTVIIIVPTLYNEFMSKIPEVHFKRFIFDEPHQQPIVSMKPIRASFIWFVCATPELMIDAYIRKRHSFMTNISLNIDHHLLSLLSIKNSDQDIENSFKMPKTNHKWYKCYSHAYYICNGMVPKSVQQCLESGDISGAMTLLGVKETDNLIDHIIDKKQKELTFCKLELQFLSEAKENENKCEKLSKRILLLETDLGGIQERYIETMKGECPICSDAMTNTVLEPNCCTMFCGSCLLTWLTTNDTCPMCRTHILPEKLITIKPDENNNTQLQKVKLMTKEECILNIIHGNKKYIIVSENNNSFLIISRILSVQNIKFVSIHGNVQMIDKYIDEYRTSDTTNILLLNSNINSSGLNLVETTDIIFYHKMNDQITEQVIGRANRLGRTTELTVHHLKYE